MLCLERETWCGFKRDNEDSIQFIKGDLIFYVWMSRTNLIIWRPTRFQGERNKSKILLVKLLIIFSCLQFHVWVAKFKAIEIHSCTANFLIHQKLKILLVFSMWKKKSLLFCTQRKNWKIAQLIRMIWTKERKITICRRGLWADVVKHMRIDKND